MSNSGNSWRSNERLCWSCASWRDPLDGVRVSGLRCRVCFVLLRWQYVGPDLTPLTYNLNNSETTSSEKKIHAEFKSKEICNEYFRSASEKRKHIPLKALYSKPKGVDKCLLIIIFPRRNHTVTVYFDTLCSLYVCPKNKQRKTLNTTEHTEKRQRTKTRS